MNALLKNIREHGMYGTGKFDEYYSTTTFFGVITQSIRSLLVQSVSLTSNMIGRARLFLYYHLSSIGWKKNLLQVIAGCERMFLDMFPNMEIYVGEPPTSEPVPPLERKYRMHSMISDLVIMLTKISPIILV